MVRQKEGTTRLVSGHQLALLGDPCVGVVKAGRRCTASPTTSIRRRCGGPPKKTARGLPKPDGRIPAFIFTQPRRRCVLRKPYTRQSPSSLEGGGEEAWQ